jgi:hypothetical protein
VYAERALQVSTAPGTSEHLKLILGWDGTFSLTQRALSNLENIVLLMADGQDRYPGI